jgi:hypothetical protein
MRHLADIALGIYNSVMRYELQKRIQSEMDARIPRWLRGSPQNLFRHTFYFFRCRGHSFDESVEKATVLTQQREPGFSPTILSPSRN